VKNQYFGDKRDYFKYGLLEALVEGVPGIARLTCIWMRTPDVFNGDGQRPFIANASFIRLTAFLMECRSRGTRDLRVMGDYFGGRAYSYYPYGENPDQIFSMRGRAEYFGRVPDAALTNAIVFFDPDNGLEPASTVSAAHLRYEELRSVFVRMNRASIAVVYQHLPRVRADLFWPAVASRIGRHLGAPVAYATDRDVSFYVIPRLVATLPAIRDILDRMVTTGLARHADAWRPCARAAPRTNLRGRFRPASPSPPAARSGSR
jgi:hypothetical protein